MVNIRIEHRNRIEKNAKALKPFTVEEAKKAMEYHKSFPEYSETPLVKLDNLAQACGVKSIYVKDESYRFGLNAFKVLGGSYALGNYIADKLGVDICQLPYEVLVSEEIKDKLGELTFVTATDGNHGRGVAWTANRLGQNCVVYMPKGSAEERLQNIRSLGADASITDLNYDDAVRLANENAEKYGWVMVQDTAWDGYEKIPTWIMQGYMTMAYEAAEQLKGDKPTHIFIQAGVGALSGGVAGFFSNYFPEEKPIITIVEPDKASCLFDTARANDGKLHPVTGDMDTIMAGLACGEPCTIGWDVLNNFAENFISMPDEIAARGMRVLGNPIGEDKRIISGESGAATTGFVTEILLKDEYKEMRDILKLNENSKILCFSTEGDTDREGYRNIVWDGAYPTSNFLINKAVSQ